MTGIIISSAYVHRKHAKVNPIPHHYEEPGEKPYIKWHCPVCTMLGNRKISIPEKIPDCPLCGVHLNWDRKGEVYLLEEYVLKETDPFCRWLNEQNAISPHPKTVEEPETAQCLGCGKTIHAGERAWKRRGFLGFYHSAECLLRDTRYAETVMVTEGLLREEELERGCTFIDMDA